MTYNDDGPIYSNLNTKYTGCCCSNVTGAYYDPDTDISSCPTGYVLFGGTLCRQDLNHSCDFDNNPCPPDYMPGYC